MSDELSEKLIQQRIRNRIIEVLELFSDSSMFQVASSNLEFWGDWVDEEALLKFSSDVFSQDEILAMARVNSSWESVNSDSLQLSTEWLSLSEASRSALSIFMRRGRLSEDEENA